jgi:hypothetical protein
VGASFKPQDVENEMELPLLPVIVMIVAVAAWIGYAILLLIDEIRRR